MIKRCGTNRRLLAHAQKLVDRHGGVGVDRAAVVHRLADDVEDAAERFAGSAVARPEHWLGYCVKPQTIEFWQDRPGRLHDRFQYRLQESGGWRIERLSP